MLAGKMPARTGGMPALPRDRNAAILAAIFCSETRRRRGKKEGSGISWALEVELHLLDQGGEVQFYVGIGVAVEGFEALVDDVLGNV